MITKGPFQTKPFRDFVNLSGIPRPHGEHCRPRTSTELHPAQPSLPFPLSAAHTGPGRRRSAAGAEGPPRDPLCPRPAPPRAASGAPGLAPGPAAPSMHRGATREAPLTSQPRHWAAAPASRARAAESAAHRRNARPLAAAAPGPAPAAGWAYKSGSGAPSAPLAPGV